MFQVHWNMARPPSGSHDPLNHQLNAAWNVEGMELLAKCLTLRNKLELDTDRRRVHFTLPMGGGKFLPDQMYAVTENMGIAASS